MSRSLIITGTDTGVGKTVVTAALARALRAKGAAPAVRKPFASGVAPGCSFLDDDGLLLQAAAGGGEPIEVIRPEPFQAPLAPLSAARLEGRPSRAAERLESLLQGMKRHEITLVEGVGGAAVPVAEGLLFSDFARMVGAPALIVARSALGTVNHTLLTVEHLQSRGIEIAGVVFVRNAQDSLSLAEEIGPPLAAEFAGVRNFGLLPHVPALAGARTVEEALAALPSGAEAIQAVAEWLLSR